MKFLHWLLIVVWFAITAGVGEEERSARTLTLPGGLKVVLVSDPKIDIAAASMDVYIGSLANPIERQRAFLRCESPLRS